MRAFLTQIHARFSFGCGVMVGLGKPKLCTKFEVPSFTHCANIEVEVQNFGELFSSPSPCPLFPMTVIL